MGPLRFSIAPFYWRTQGGIKGHIFKRVLHVTNLEIQSSAVQKRNFKSVFGICDEIDKRL